VHAADALSFPFGLALKGFCKERAFFPYTRAGPFALSAYDFLVSEAANGEDWINVRSRRSRLDTHRGCGFQSSFWAESVTLRTRGSTVYRLFRQKVAFAGARTSQHEHVFLQTWRWMKVDIFLMH
jgi:hypothetical protein